MAPRHGAAAISKASGAARRGRKSAASTVARGTCGAGNPGIQQCHQRRKGHRHSRGIDKRCRVINCHDHRIWRALHDAACAKGQANRGCGGRVHCQRRRSRARIAGTGCQIIGGIAMGADGDRGGHHFNLTGHASGNRPTREADTARACRFGHGAAAGANCRIRGRDNCSRHDVRKGQTRRRHSRCGVIDRKRKRRLLTLGHRAWVEGCGECWGWFNRQVGRGRCCHCAAKGVQRRRGVRIGARRSSRRDRNRNRNRTAGRGRNRNAGCRQQAGPAQRCTASVGAGRQGNGGAGKHRVQIIRKRQIVQRSCRGRIGNAECQLCRARGRCWPVKGFGKGRVCPRKDLQSGAGRVARNSQPTIGAGNRITGAGIGVRGRAGIDSNIQNNRTACATRQCAGGICEQTTERSSPAAGVCCNARHNSAGNRASRWARQRAEIFAKGDAVNLPRAQVGQGVFHLRRAASKDRAVQICFRQRQLCRLHNQTVNGGRRRPRTMRQRAGRTAVSAIRRAAGHQQRHINRTGRGGRHRPANIDQECRTGQGTATGVRCGRAGCGKPGQRGRKTIRK